MTKSMLKKVFICVLLIYLVAIVGLYFIAGDQFRYQQHEIINNTSDTPIAKLTDNTSVSQRWTVPFNVLNQIAIRTATYDRINYGMLRITLQDAAEITEYFSIDVPTETLPNNDWFVLPLQDSLYGMENTEVVLTISAQMQSQEDFVTIWSSNETIGNTALSINSQPVSGSLNVRLAGLELRWFGQHYWTIMLIVWLIFAIYFVWSYYKFVNGRSNLLLVSLNAFFKYQFLLSQLIARDFKTKYKRSVLGMLWSILNPLLTMLVQYVVFSTLFKNDIPNFPVYLLVGIVMFSFFTECCGMGVTAITGNAALITKVYVPKYIYPLTRTASSMVNLLFALIPLLLVMVITKVPITASLLLVPFGLICLVIFSAGITFALSAAMVFFRDTQFLWNVLSLLWMYATPIFYPESIIPPHFSFIIKLNPMYHFIRFVRGIILGGVSPEPKAYLYCLVFAVGTFLLGLLFFKKTQDKFIINL